MEASRTENPSSEPSGRRVHPLQMRSPKQFALAALRQKVWFTNAVDPSVPGFERSIHVDVHDSRHPAQAIADYLKWFSKWEVGPPKPGHFTRRALRDMGLVGLYRRRFE